MFRLNVLLPPVRTTVGYNATLGTSCSLAKLLCTCTYVYFINLVKFIITFRQTIEAPAGLRLVELRHPADGAVIHHWEFLTAHPPTSFTLPVSELNDILRVRVVKFSILALDDRGNIAKQEFDLCA